MTPETAHPILKPLTSILCNTLRSPMKEGDMLQELRGHFLLLETSVGLTNKLDGMPTTTQYPRHKLSACILVYIGASSPRTHTPSLDPQQQRNIRNILSACILVNSSKLCTHIYISYVPVRRLDPHHGTPPIKLTGVYSNALSL